MIQAVVKKGNVIGEKVPTPNVSEGCLLIKVVNSCISAGTEMTSVGESGKPLYKRALEQPEQVKEVLDFARQNGIKKTIQKIKGTLDGGKPTGYSVSGVVLGIGKNVSGFQVGDHVAAAGAGLANHAEYVDVPQNLVMHLPKGLDFKTASTVTMGGIALQGVRRCDLRLGEVCVVVGAGILGLLAQQMLQASGVRTIVTDIDDKRLALAKELGATLVLNPTKEDIIQVAHQLTGGYGADAVLFTAATSSNEPLSQSFKMCKKKGKVVLVGVSGMELKRGDMYRKELDFLISTSYGPGRYDNAYEGKGLDYPYAYVRWTENRNMTEYLRLVQEGKINVDKLISAVYPIESVEEAFASLKSEKKPIITLLDYGTAPIPNILQATLPEKRIDLKSSSHKKGAIQVAIIGAGSFATGMHLPNMLKMDSKYQLRAVVNRKGQTGVAVGKQFGAAYTTTDVSEVLQDTEVDLVMITTRHDNHASLTLQALQAGKHVFVEKPMATNQEDLDAIKAFYADGSANKPVLMVGFNRRFSKYAQEITKHTAKRVNPLFVHYRMNAGFIPLDHWVHEHGGRMVGECCHIIDLMTALTGTTITSISQESLSPSNEKYSHTDNRAIILKYEDGSVCTIHYFAVGSKKYPKEFMEVHFDDKTITMDNYKKLEGFGVKVPSLTGTISQKGQLEELEALYDTLSGKTNDWPIALWDMIQTTEASFVINEEAIAFASKMETVL